jgi:hypothetical protein
MYAESSANVKRRHMLQTLALIFIVLFLLGVVPGAVLNIIAMALVSMLVYELLKYGKS